MDNQALQPDAPFRSGISGKYKLLINSVTPKFGEYEYVLADVEGKEYKATSKKHYLEGQILRCIVAFMVRNARLVVIDTAVCSKQDFATLIPEPPKPEAKSKPQVSKTFKPQTKTKSKVAANSQPKPTKPAKTPAKNKPPKVVLGDPKHRKTTGTYVFKVAAVNQVGEVYSYKVVGAKGQLYDVQSKVLFPEGTLVDCNAKVSQSPGGLLKVFVSSIKKHVSVVVKTSGTHCSKPNKNWRKSSGGRDWFGGPNVGDHFHLIYTPMGNKR